MRFSSRSSAPGDVARTRGTPDSVGVPMLALASWWLLLLLVLVLILGFALLLRLVVVVLVVGRFTLLMDFGVRNFLPVCGVVADGDADGLGGRSSPPASTFWK